MSKNFRSPRTRTVIYFTYNQSAFLISLKHAESPSRSISPSLFGHHPISHSVPCTYTLTLALAFPPLSIHSHSSGSTPLDHAYVITELLPLLRASAVFRIAHSAPHIHTQRQRGDEAKATKRSVRERERLCWPCHIEWVARHGASAPSSSRYVCR